MPPASAVGPVTEGAVDLDRRQVLANSVLLGAGTPNL